VNIRCREDDQNSKGRAEQKQKWEARGKARTLYCFLKEGVVCEGVVDILWRQIGDRQLKLSSKALCLLILGTESKSVWTY
jgi:hypothetical protein